jgi:hypothetical protein
MPHLFLSFALRLCSYKRTYDPVSMYISLVFARLKYHHFLSLFSPSFERVIPLERLPFPSFPHDSFRVFDLGLHRQQPPSQRYVSFSRVSADSPFLALGSISILPDTHARTLSTRFSLNDRPSHWPRFRITLELMTGHACVAQYKGCNQLQ